MATNANVFNSRVTSEALEAKFRQVFPAQAGAELIQDLYASGVIQPVIDFSSVAEGSFLPQNLQTAWDFSTGNQSAQNGTQTIITNTGFWLVNITVGIDPTAGADDYAELAITDGLTSKPVFRLWTPGTSTENRSAVAAPQIIYLRTGDSATITSSPTGLTIINANWRQIADVNGNLVNPLGFTFQ